MEFKKYTVEELVKLNMLEKPMDGNHGGKHPTSKDYVENGIPFIMVSDINNGKINYKSCKFISKTTRNGLDKGFSKPNDILLSHKATIGLTAIVGEEFEEIVLTPQLTYYRVKNNINNKYLKYYFDSKYFQNILNNWATSGSTRAYLGITAQLKLPILLPDIIVQNKIAKILSDIDNKIQLNNLINDNLHELVIQNYLKYLDEIKEVDEVDELDIRDIFDFETGVEPGSKNYLENAEEDTIKFYRVGDMNSECKTFIKKELANNKYLNENDIVVSFDATIGRIGYGLTGSYSTGMKKISVKNKYNDTIDNSMVYAYFNNSDIQNIMLENARGTTILHASSSIDFMIFKYNELLLKKYGKFISTLFKKMKNIKKENERLSKLRDTLLPKLMNGEIDLDKIEL